MIYLSIYNTRILQNIYFVLQNIVKYYTTYNIIQDILNIINNAIH